MVDGHPLIDDVLNETNRKSSKQVISKAEATLDAYETYRRLSGLG